MNENIDELVKIFLKHVFIKKISNLEICTKETIELIRNNITDFIEKNPTHILSSLKDDTQLPVEMVIQKYFAEENIKQKLEFLSSLYKISNVYNDLDYSMYD